MATNPVTSVFAGVRDLIWDATHWHQTTWGNVLTDGLETLPLLGMLSKAATVSAETADTLSSASNATDNAVVSVPQSFQLPTSLAEDTVAVGPRVFRPVNPAYPPNAGAMVRADSEGFGARVALEGTVTTYRP